MTQRATRGQEKALERLNDRRRELEERLSDVRRSLQRELGGWAPSRAVWAVPLIGFALGVALALKLRGRRDD